MKVINDQNYKQVVNTPDKLILIDFHAEWCGPCKTMSPIIDKLEVNNPDIVFGKADVDQCPEFSGNNGIRSIPTLLIMKDGNVLSKLVGSRTQDSIQVELDKYSF